MRSLTSLLVLLWTCCAYSQALPEASKSNSRWQESTARSATYNDTLRTIEKWVESEENDDLARLLEVGDIRTPDLVAACHSSDSEIAGAAFGALQLLGKPECEPCADSVSKLYGGLAVACSASISEADFQRIERWMAEKRTGTGYECGEEYEPLTPMDDSVVYALILDASSRSQSVLNDMLGVEKFCVTDATTIIGEILEPAQSLIGLAKQASHNLRVERDELKNSIRASAFFLPKKYRKDSEVEVISRNRARNRILLEVSYSCGNLCGKGYYVMLRKDGTHWHYAVIRMAWIS